MLPADRTRPMLMLPAPAQTALVPLPPAAWCSLAISRSKWSAGPAWLISVLTAMVVLLSLALVAQQRSFKTEAKASEAKANVEAASVEPVSMKPSPLHKPAVPDPPYPFAEFVEVTGVRVVMDLNRRPQVQYMVVNRSDTPLSNIGLKIAVRPAVDTPGLDPFFTVAARVPSLGPHQSKEIRTDLDSDLRADVQITSQQ